MQALTWLILLSTSAVSRAAENPLSASTGLSNEGYFVLNWDTGDDSTPLTLEQSTTTGFDDVISRDIAGAGALTITGLEDGQYYYRLSRDGTPVSTPIQVTVEHHSLARAGSFFLLGLVLFSTLVFIILNGNRRVDI